MFDCFWRMRIKSNYGTIDPYLVAQISDADHQIFNQSLCTATRASISLLEIFIARKAGKPAFQRVAEDFVAQDSHDLTARMLGARLGAYGML